MSVANSKKGFHQVSYTILQNPKPEYKMWWISAILFFVLSPGVLLTIPSGSRGFFMSGQTSVLAAAVHAIVFAVVSQYVWTYYRTGSY